MVSPNIDKQGQPFSYFSQPTDEIGVMNAPAATEITPEGYLYTGYGELMFFLGPQQTPVSARIRTLEDGYLPIDTYVVHNQGITYTFTAFSAQVPAMPTKDDTPTGEIVNFVRIAIHNPGTEPRAGFLTTAIRYQAPQTTGVGIADNRFWRPAKASKIGDYSQPGEPFSSNWSYSMENGVCYRHGTALYTYPQMPGTRLSLTLHTSYNAIRPLTSNSLDLSPTTPACAAMYTVPLAAGETKVIDLRMPLIPPARGSQEWKTLLNAQFDNSHAEVVNFWKTVLAKGMQLSLPETKPVDTFYASLVYDLLGRNIIHGQFVQTSNQFQYHAFFIRDSANFVRMYDFTGYPEVAGQVLSFFKTQQLPDGNFMSQAGQYDGWGEALATYGEHYRMTHNLAFAESVYPRVVRAVDWLIAARAKDPMHLMPASDVHDDEDVAGHLTGYNFWALDGLKSAIELARATGHKQDAARFESEYNNYRTTFMKALTIATEKDGGVLPPSLDAGKWRGTDWGNLLSVFPVPVLNPSSPWVTNTLRYTQARYREGIMTYSEPQNGTYLHLYLTIDNSLTELVRENQEQVIRELYAELLHTSSTQAGFEFAIRPWGNRNFEGNLAPHNWFASDYRILLRNMMVREQGENLHLLSAVSPDWVGEGKTIAVERVPTYFGSVGFTFKTINPGEAEMALRTQWTDRPQHLFLHLPWFLTVTRVKADGHLLVIQHGAVELPLNTKLVQIWWSKRLPVMMNFEKTVQSYEAEYRLRYDYLLRTGKTYPETKQWHVPE